MSVTSHATDGENARVPCIGWATGVASQVTPLRANIA